MNPCTVSIVIALYRKGEFLEAALRSALSQTFTDFEILISDDDPSGLAIGDDPRVRYRRNDRTLGPCGNHAAAFREARGRYVAILNHDDVWEPTFLEKLIAPLEKHPEVVVAFCDHFIVDKTGETLEKASDVASRKFKREGLAEGIHPFPELLANQTIPLAMGSVFRRSALSKDCLAVDVGPAYDLWLTYLLCATGEAAYYVPERLSRWRVHESNLSHGRGLAWALGSARCWGRIAGDPRLKEIKKTARRKAGESYRVAARSLAVRLLSLFAKEGR